MSDAPDTLTMEQAAREAGVAKETFRKVWRGWADPASPSFVDFPPPFRAPPAGQRGTYAWRRSAVAAWKLARERVLGAGHARPPPPRQGHEGPHATVVRFKQERATLASFINGRS